MASWKDNIQIDKNWVSSQLAHHFQLQEPKLSIRAYTIKFSGNLSKSGSLIEALAMMVKAFVYNPAKIKQLGSDKALLEALKFFGPKDPLTDGKYGELLLFALVEAVLECKMVAHKIRTLSNYKDQVKGGDGIFLGEYQIADNEFADAYLIGEAKIMNKRSDSITESLSSLNRFHEMIESSEFMHTEFMVAKENMIVDDTVDADELYDRLTPGTDRFKKQVLVHPILLMFNTTKIDGIEREAKNNEDAENKIRDFANSQKQQLLKYVKKTLEEFTEVSKVYLDFFVLPVKDVNEFRESFYYYLHNAPYPRNG